FAISTRLLTEAGTEANEGQRQIFGFENLILVHTRDRDLGSTDEKQFFALDSVDLVTSLGELPIADEAEVACHGGYDQRRKALAGDAIHSKVHQRQFHTG